MKKGFTLAETIGVIIVLGLIAVVVIPFVDHYIQNSKEKAYQSNILKIKEASINWNAKYGSMNGCDTECFLPIEKLKESEFLSEDAIKNPLTKENIDGEIRIYKENNKYNYEILVPYYFVSDTELTLENISKTRPTDKKVYFKVFFDELTDQNSSDVLPQVCVYNGEDELCLKGNDTTSSRDKVNLYYGEENCTYEDAPGLYYQNITTCVANSTRTQVLGNGEISTFDYNSDFHCDIDINNSDVLYMCYYSENGGGS